jgi:type II secretory pathway component PulC
MTRSPVRMAAVGALFVLAVGAGIGASAEPTADAGAGLRLAAIVQDGGDGMALLATGEQQAWLRPGEQLGQCVLLSIEPAAALLSCDGLVSRMPLAAGMSGAPALARSTTLVELPPGAIEALAARPQALALGLDIVPDFDRGLLRGWRIAMLDESNPLFPLGLRQNDLVLAVAGFPATEPRSLALGLRSLPASGSFSITVERDDQLVDLEIIAAVAPASR